MNLAGNNRFAFQFAENKLNEDLTKLNLDFKTISDHVTEVNIPGLSIGYVEQPNPIKPIYIAGSGSLEYDDLNITFILDEEYKVFKNIVKWITNIHSAKEVQQQYNLTIDADCMILDNQQNYIFSINFESLFPINIDGFPLVTNVTEKEEIFISATFKYLSYKID